MRLERLGYDAGDVIGHKSTEFLSESRRYAAEKVLPELFRTGACADALSDGRQEWRSCRRAAAGDSRA